MLVENFRKYCAEKRQELYQEHSASSNEATTGGTSGGSQSPKRKHSEKNEELKSIKIKLLSMVEDIDYLELSNELKSNFEIIKNKINMDLNEDGSNKRKCVQTKH